MESGRGLGPRRSREKYTVEAMIRIRCAGEHGTRQGELCEGCRVLADYANQRLVHCPHGEGKPVCADCTIHCYRPAEREEIRAVMRYAGPRMPFRHPILALRHLIDKQRRPKPRSGSAR